MHAIGYRMRTLRTSTRPDEVVAPSHAVSILLRLWLATRQTYYPRRPPASTLLQIPTFALLR
jgi:hypothetical protein